jgi:hypothetical protein
MPQYQISLRSGMKCLQTNGRADGWAVRRTDGGILIDAPRRSDHTQNYVIYNEWTAVNTGKKKQVLILTTVRTLLAIRNHFASRLLSICNFSAAKIRRTNPYSLPRWGECSMALNGWEGRGRRRGIALLLSVQRSRVECSELLVSTGTRHDLPIQPSQCRSRVSKNIPYLNSNVLLQLCF